MSRNLARENRMAREFAEPWPPPRRLMRLAGWRRHAAMQRKHGGLFRFLLSAARLKAAAAASRAPVLLRKYLKTLKTYEMWQSVAI
jgi:hypothetical protein